MLPRYQAQPGRELSAIFKPAGIADGSNERSGIQGADTRYLHQSLADGMTLSQLLYLPIRLFHSIIQGAQFFSQGTK